MSLYQQDEVSTYFESSNITGQLQSHFHYVNEIILVSSGSAEFTVNGESFLASENHIFFLSSLEEHSVEIVDAPYERYVILLSNKFIFNHFLIPEIMAVLSNHSLDFEYNFHLDEQSFAKIEDSCRKLLTEYSEKMLYWEDAFASLVTQILIDFLRMYPLEDIASITKQSSQMLEIQKYINNHFNDDISLQNLSKKFFISESQLSRNFKEFTGRNLSNYIIATRLLKAKEQLLSSNEPIHKIANEVGYSNANHFSRIFKNYENISPSEFRKIYESKVQNADENPIPDK